MANEAEKVIDEVASDISEAISDANEQTAKAEAVAEEIAEAALEGARGERIRNLEKEMDECLNNQASMAEALTTLALAQERMAGQLSTLLQPLPLTQDQEPESEKEDGQPESQEVQEAIAPEAPEPEAPIQEVAEKVKRQAKRWI